MFRALSRLLLPVSRVLLCCAVVAVAGITRAAETSTFSPAETTPADTQADLPESETPNVDTAEATVVPSSESTNTGLDSQADAAFAPLSDRPADDTPEVETADPVQEAVLQQARLDLPVREQRVDALETLGTGYSLELQDAWMALGTTQLVLDLSDEASLSFGKALQMARSELGLYDPGQIPILQKQFDTNLAAGQWEEASNNAWLINHIARKSYAPGDSRRMAALTGLGKWLVHASSRAVLPNRARNAADAIKLYDAELELVQGLQAYPEQRLQVANLNLHIAEAEFLLVNIVNSRSIREYQTSTRNTTTSVQCQYVRLANGRMGQICNTVELPNFDNYVDPSNLKSQDLWLHLNAMKAHIVTAFDTLNAETTMVQERDASLEYMQTLTGQYNNFVSNR